MSKSKIVLELSQTRKAAYVRAARPATLADWIFRHLDAASGFKPCRHCGGDCRNVCARGEAQQQS